MRFLIVGVGVGSQLNSMGLTTIHAQTHTHTRAMMKGDVHKDSDEDDQDDGEDALALFESLPEHITVLISNVCVCV